MRVRVSLIVLVVLATSSSMAQKPSGNSSAQIEVEREIRKLTRLWDKAMVKRDITFLESNLADEYVISGLTKPQYLEFVKSSDINYTSFDREVVSVRVYGETALVLGQANVNGQSSPMGWFSSSFSFMDVWVKQQSRWRCVATKAEEIVQTFQKERVVKFGPDVKADLVIVFKSDVLSEQVEDFRRNVLQITTSTEGEREYSSGIRQYLRVLPIQEHEAIALTFYESITLTQREEIMRRVKSSPLVYRVFEDVAPANVKLNQ